MLIHLLHGCSRVALDPAVQVPGGEPPDAPEPEPARVATSGEARPRPIHHVRYGPDGDLRLL